MPTTVVSSIGTTGRDYSTLQAWEDACPANLVTDDKIWKGECYKDSEFSAGVTISGVTTDATRYIWLTAAAGQSFQDNASVRTNPLFYDATKGVGITNSSALEYLVYVANLHVTVERLQVKLAVRATYLSNICLKMPYSASGNVTKDCILYQSTTNTSSPGRCADFGGTGSTAINVLGIQCATNANAFLHSDSTRMYNCTAIAIGANSAAGYGGTPYSDGGNCLSCAAFNFASFNSGPSASYSYCGSNLASVPGSNPQVSLTFADCFESTTTDFRLKASSPLIGVGNTNASYPNDISGFTRGTGTAGDIGAWEYGAATSNSITPRRFRQQHLLVR